MYHYGITIAAAKKLVPNLIDMTNCVNIGNLNIECFNGDCGALAVRGANYANKDDIDSMLLLASHTGHSKIFVTIVGNNTMVDRQTQLFVDAGFIIINTGYSNRIAHKKDVVLFHHNANCHKKGY